MATKVLTWSTGPGKWIILVCMILSLGGFHTEQHVEFYFWCQSTLTLHQEQVGLLWLLLQGHCPRRLTGSLSQRYWCSPCSPVQEREQELREVICQVYPFIPFTKILRYFYILYQIHVIAYVQFFNPRACLSTETSKQDIERSTVTELRPEASWMETSLHTCLQSCWWLCI